jgi:hypothetical protein
LLDNDVMAGHHPDRHWAHTNREPGSRGIGKATDRLSQQPQQQRQPGQPPGRLERLELGDQDLGQLG